MGLILRITQSLILSSNFWFTFKALKKPRKNRSRTDRDASSRAAQLRKRDIKICLIVWTVWSLATCAEPWSDRIVGFLPFYNEIKTLLWLLLLCLRSLIAVPVFDNFVRPSIKPYAPFIDSTLDLLFLISELCLSTLLWPIHQAQAWWSSRKTPTTNEDNAASRPPTANGNSSRGSVDVAQLRSQLQSASTQMSSILTDVDEAIHLVQGRRPQTRSATGASSSPAPLSNSRAGRYDMVDTASLNFNDESAVPKLRTRKRSTQPTSTSSASAPIGAHVPSRLSSQMDEASTATYPPAPTRTSSHSSPTPTTPSAPPPQPSEPRLTPNRGSWFGVYPPLPSAYPATPAPSRPLSLAGGSMSPPPAKEVYREREAYPPFPSAYPFTPAPVRAELAPETEVDMDGEGDGTPRAQSRELSPFIMVGSEPSTSATKSSKPPSSSKALPNPPETEDIDMDDATQDTEFGYSNGHTRGGRSRTLASAVGMRDGRKGVSEAQKRRVVSASSAPAPTPTEPTPTTTATTSRTTAIANTTYKTNTSVPQKRAIPPEIQAGARGSEPATARKRSGQVIDLTADSDSEEEEADDGRPPLGKGKGSKASTKPTPTVSEEPQGKRATRKREILAPLPAGGAGTSFDPADLDVAVPTRTESAPRPAPMRSSTRTKGPAKEKEEKEYGGYTAAATRTRRAK